MATRASTGLKRVTRIPRGPADRSGVTVARVESILGADS